MAVENIPPKARITGKAFRLSKMAKRRLALQSFPNDEVRASYRRMMIEAQVAANTVVKRDRNEKTTRGPTAE